MIIKGAAFKLGDHVSTDEIYPARYLYDAYDPEKMGRRAFEGCIDSFSERAGGSIIVAGLNFGCGSSREQAVLALKYAGIKAVVASSFARTFFRNAIAFALPVLECLEAVRAIETGDLLEVDLGSAEVSYPGGRVTGRGFPREVLGIIEAGGLIPYARRRLAGV